MTYKNLSNSTYQQTNLQSSRIYKNEKNLETNLTIIQKEC